ncbi:MAG: TetR/AcrR family transcriptional regulator [Syntrophomonas sp.]
MKIEERILNACTELTQTRGLRNFTVDELAARAGVSKRTLYRYYRSKDEIIEAVVENFINRAAAEGDRIIKLEANPVNIINHMLSYLFANGRFITGDPGLNDLRQYYPHLWEKIERFRSERIAMVIGIINCGRREQAADAIDPRIITTAILASIQAVLNPDFILDNGLSFEKTAEQLIRFLLSAVAEKQESRNESFSFYIEFSISRINSSLHDCIARSQFIREMRRTSFRLVIWFCPL